MACVHSTQPLSNYFLKLHGVCVCVRRKKKKKSREGVSQFVHVNALETNELSNQCHDIFVKRAFSQPLKSFPVFTRLSVTQSQKAYNKKKPLQTCWKAG